MQETGGKTNHCDATGAEEKKVQEEGSATFHFVHSDMMKYLITDSEHRLEREGKSDTGRNEGGRQKRMKCNTRGVKEK